VYAINGYALHGWSLASWMVTRFMDDHSGLAQSSYLTKRFASMMVRMSFRTRSTFYSSFPALFNLSDSSFKNQSRLNLHLCGVSAERSIMNLVYICVHFKENVFFSCMLFHCQSSFLFVCRLKYMRDNDPDQTRALIPAYR
jgi:hypothetical protein